jgi:RimJ/RimL family protein N-acetyltransferase
MITDLYRGRLVRLAAPDPEHDAEIMARWSFDSEFQRLLDSDPARPRTAKQSQAEEERRAQRANQFSFNVRTLEDDRLIGFVGLWVRSWTSGEGGVGIGIGERANWSKGYGTDAMRLMLRYAFAELNLSRVSLEVFAHNTRAIRSYEKAGFRREGVQREWARRDGRRWDVVSMGILADEMEGLGDVCTTT